MIQFRWRRLRRFRRHTMSALTDSVGPQTVAAICEFQKGFLDQPDGLADVEGPTWQRLAEAQLQAIDEEKG